MKFARSLTRNMPKYLIVFFGLLLVFNVFAFFLTPGIKEGHEGKEKKKLDKKLEQIDQNRMKQDGLRAKVKDNEIINGMFMKFITAIDPKPGKDVKADDIVAVAKKQK